MSTRLQQEEALRVCFEEVKADVRLKRAVGKGWRLPAVLRQGLAYAKRALLHAQYYAHLLGAAVSGRQKTCLVKAADWLGAAPVGAGGEAAAAADGEDEEEAFGVDEEDEEEAAAAADGEDGEDEEMEPLASGGQPPYVSLEQGKTLLGTDLRMELWEKPFPEITPERLQLLLILATLSRVLLQSGQALVLTASGAIDAADAITAAAERGEFDAAEADWMARLLRECVGYVQHRMLQRFPEAEHFPMMQFLARNLEGFTGHKTHNDSYKVGETQRIICSKFLLSTPPGARTGLLLAQAEWLHNLLGSARRKVVISTNGGNAALVVHHTELAADSGMTHAGYASVADADVRAPIGGILVDRPDPGQKVPKAAVPLSPCETITPIPADATMGGVSVWEQLNFPLEASGVLNAAQHDPKEARSAGGTASRIAQNTRTVLVVREDQPDAEPVPMSASQFRALVQYRAGKAFGGVNVVDSGSKGGKVNGERNQAKFLHQEATAEQQARLSLPAGATAAVAGQFTQAEQRGIPPGVLLKDLHKTHPLVCEENATGRPLVTVEQRHYLTERIKGGAVLLYPLIEAMREHFVQPPVMSVEQWQNLVGGVKKALGGAAKVGRNSTGRGKRSEADWEAAREDATIKREQMPALQEVLANKKRKGEEGDE